jgi:hypothetical protein
MSHVRREDQTVHRVAHWSFIAKTWAEFEIQFRTNYIVQ